MHLDQQKKRFLQQRHIPEPTMLVERPPSPGAFETETLNTDSSDGRSTPHYMRPLKSRAKSASFVPTIDMFSVVKKKKVNLWEAAQLEKQAPNFHRRVLPSYPLSTDELRQLQKDYAHKLNKLQISSQPSSRMHLDKSKVKATHYRVTVPAPKPPPPVKSTTIMAKQHGKPGDGVFLTQLLKTDTEEQNKLAYQSLQDFYNAKRVTSASVTEAGTTTSVIAPKTKVKPRKHKSAKQHH